jgi:pimeloyl-ACP methyl ester carboxylesterase
MASPWLRSPWARGLSAAGALAIGATAGAVLESSWSRRRLTETSRPPAPRVAHATRLLRVRTDDGRELHAQIDTPEGWRIGDPTVVFVHGFALDLTTWQHQQAALLQIARVVSYDHRGHGRSADAYRDGDAALTIDRLGLDLAAVLGQCTDLQDITLVGHSMGGMTVMALAERQADWFGDSIVAVAFVATTSGPIGSVTLGLPVPVARLAHRLTPTLGVVNRQPWLEQWISRVRDSGSDVSRVLTRAYAFGDDAPEHGTNLVAHLIGTTPLPVMTDLLRSISDHDRRAALDVVQRVPVLIIVGSSDHLTPATLSRAMHAAMPDSRLLILPGGGHMVMLEAPAEVDEALLEFVESVASTVNQ